MNRLQRILAVPLFMLVTLAAPASADDEALALFKRRITPILRSANPSSCSECHLSGVDLKDYIGDTQEETFASLRSAGLINMQKPDESKLLTFIHRTPPNAIPVSRKARQQEFIAFRAWIRVAVEKGESSSADQIPEPSNVFALLSGQQLRNVDLPERLGKKNCVQMFLFGRASVGRPGRGLLRKIRATENVKCGRARCLQRCQSGQIGADRAATLRKNHFLPDGRYLIKLYIDRDDRLKKNLDYELGQSDLYGQVETDGEWKFGHQPHSRTSKELRKL
jgi:hypothetical protein